MKPLLSVVFPFPLPQLIISGLGRWHIFWAKGVSRKMEIAPNLDHWLLNAKFCFLILVRCFVYSIVTTEKVCISRFLILMFICTPLKIKIILHGFKVCI